MNTIILNTNSKKLVNIFSNEVNRLNMGLTSYSTPKDFMEHLLALSMYILSWTECTIEKNNITTWKLEYKKRYYESYNINIQFNK